MTAAGRKRYGYIDQAKSYANDRGTYFYNEAEKLTKEFEDEKAKYGYGKTEKGLKELLKDDDWFVPGKKQKDRTLEDAKEYYKWMYESKDYQTQGRIYDEEIKDYTRKATGWFNLQEQIKNTPLNKYTEKDLEHLQDMGMLYVNGFSDMNMDDYNDYKLSVPDILKYKK